MLERDANKTDIFLHVVLFYLLKEDPFSVSKSQVNLTTAQSGASRNFMVGGSRDPLPSLEHVVNKDWYIVHYDVY